MLAWILVHKLPYDHQHSTSTPFNPRTCKMYPTHWSHFRNIKQYQSHSRSTGCRKHCDRKRFVLTTYHVNDYVLHRYPPSKLRELIHINTGGMDHIKSWLSYRYQCLIPKRSQRYPTRNLSGIRYFLIFTHRKRHISVTFSAKSPSILYFYKKGF